METLGLESETSQTDSAICETIGGNPHRGRADGGGRPHQIFGLVDGHQKQGAGISQGWKLPTPTPRQLGR